MSRSLGESCPRNARGRSWEAWLGAGTVSLSRGVALDNFANISESGSAAYKIKDLNKELLNKDTH